MKKIIGVAVCAALLALLILGVYGYHQYNQYQESHITIGDQSYPLDSTVLDLREGDISPEYYEELQTQMPDCEILWTVSFQGQNYSSDTESLSVTTFTQEDAQILLNYFPALTLLEASGCQEYALLTDFQEQLPQCQVVYQVDIGGMACELDATQLTLETGDYTFDALMENLVYLPQVSAIALRNTELDIGQIEELESAYEQITFSYTVSLLGQEYSPEVTELDLSGMTPEEVEAVSQKFSLLPNLASIELMDENGESALTKEDVRILMAAAPDAAFHYTFQFYGETLSVDDEEVIISYQNIGDGNEMDVRLTLDIMKNCQRFVLDSCNLSNEVMAQIREDYRDRTKVVWRVKYGGGSSLTDVEVVRAVYGLDDSNGQDLFYCEDVVYMDIGHNVDLSDISFVAGMPNLEVVIISGSLVTDLSPFVNCQKLRILEACFCEYLVDISPLVYVSSLEMLNIGNTHVTDLSPLDNLYITLLMAKVYPSGDCRVPEEEQERFLLQHPECWASFTGSQPYGSGWRYEMDNSQMEWYAEAAKQFRYPDSPNKTGWYLS